MICDSCAWAGHKNKVGDTTTAKSLHEACKGCTCQHKIGKGWIKRSDSEHLRA